MEFQKLSHESLKDQFVRDIQQRIISGELQPGDRLPPERELAAAMGISRSLVNNGMLELESRGLVRRIPRRGTIVNDYRVDGNFTFLTELMNYQSDRIDPDLLAGMLEFRNYMEREAARLAALRATEEELAQLRAQLDIMAANPVNTPFIDASVQFHALLHSASHNPIMTLLFRSMQPVVRHLTTVHYTGNPHRDKTLALHQTLMETLEARDPQAAAAAAASVLDPGEGALKKEKPTGEKQEK